MTTYSGSTAAILSNYSNVLKTFYLPSIQEQLNQQNPLSAFIDVNEEDISGKDAKINVHYGRNKGTGARADGGAMPTADYQKHLVATVPTKYLYGRVTFSGPTIAATRDAKGAYARVIDNEITGVVKDLNTEVNRQLWGAGYGIIARWRSGTSSTTYTVQKKYRGNSAGEDFFGSTFGAKYLKENNGMASVNPTISGAITVITVDTDDMAPSVIVESADYDTLTATDPSTSEVAGSYYIRPGNAATVTAASSTAGAGRLEMMGLRGIVTNTDIDDANWFNGTYTGMASLADPLQGLSVSYLWWQAQVDTHASGRYAGQRALTFDLMQKMFDKVEIAAGKDYGPDMIQTTHAIRREYLELCQADRRFPNVMQLDHGFTGLDYNGIPLMVDPDAIDGEMYFLTTKDLQIYRMSDYAWMEKDGSILDRVTGFDAYEAILFRYAELGCRRRNSHGVICDIAYNAT